MLFYSLFLSDQTQRFVEIDNFTLLFWVVLLLLTLFRLILIEICLFKLLNTIFIVYFYFLNWMFDFCWLCRAACRSQAINAGYILYKSKVGKAGYSNIIKRLCTLVCYARWHQNAKIWMWNIKTFLWCLYSVAEYIWDMYFSLLCTVALHKT